MTDPSDKNCKTSTAIRVTYRATMVWINIQLALAYYLLARLSVEVISPESHPCPAFLPAGVALCAVLIFGRPAAIGVALGSLAMNLQMLFNEAPEVSLAMWAATVSATAASTGEALLGATLMRRSCRNSIFPDSLGQMVLWLGSLAIACLPAGLAGGLFLQTIEGIKIPLISLASRWWLGDLVGLLVGIVALRAAGLPKASTSKQWGNLLRHLFGIGLVAVPFATQSPWLVLAAFMMTGANVFFASIGGGCRTAATLILNCSLFPILLTAMAINPVADLPEGYFLFITLGMLASAWMGRRFAGRKEEFECVWRKENSLSSETTNTLSKAFLLPTGMLCITVITAQMLDLSERRQAQAYLEAIGRKAAFHLEDAIQSPLAIPEHAARGWENSDYKEKTWENFAALALGSFPYLRAVGWLEPDGVVQRILPLEGNEQLLGTNPNLEFLRRKSMTAAAGRSSTSVTPLVNLKQGGSGFITYTPLISETGEINGFFAMVFDFHRLTQECLQPVHGNFQSFKIKVATASTNVLTTGEAGTDHARKWQTSNEILAGDQPWQITVNPARQSEILPNWRLSTALLAAGLFFWPAFMFVRVLLHRSESAESRITEKSRFQKTILNSAGEAIVVTDSRFIIRLMNPEAERLTGYAESEAAGKMHIFQLHDHDEMNAKLQQAAAEDINVDDPEAAMSTAIINGLIGRDWECHLVSKHGDKIPVILTLSPLKNSTGETTGFLGVARDITKRKVDEIALANSQKRFSAIFEESPTPIIISRIADHRIQHVNRSWLAMTGFDPDEVINRTCEELCLWGNPAEKQRLYGMLAREGHIADFSAKMNTRSAGTRSVVIYANCVELDGTPCVIGQLIDQTDKIALEKAAKESSVRFEQIANHMEEVFWMFDNQKQEALYVSPAYERVFGRSIAEFFTNPDSLLDLLHPEDRSILRDALERQRCGEPTEMEYRIVHPEGGIRWIADHSVPIFDANGRLHRTTGIASDITDRVEAESRSREALAILDATSDAALIFDAETLAFSHVNQGAASMLGISKPDLLTMSMPEICRQHDSDSLRDLLEPLMTARQTALNVLLDLGIGDHATIPTETTLQYVRLPGRRSRFIALARDISQRLANEAHERRTQRLESIGTLAGGIAHDLNNSLSPVVMSMQILRDMYPKESQMLDTVESSARHASEMVRQLLNFARGAEGEHEVLQPEVLFKEIQNIVSRTFPKNIDFNITAPEDLPCIKGDPTQLHQLLLNLCVNARDAMPEGGKLSITANPLRVDRINSACIGATDSRPGEFLRLQVSDSGTGIPPALMDQIFDPFFSTKDHNKGTGLGLSSVVGIVKGHHGFLCVNSSPDTGSCFEVFLPVAGSDTTFTESKEARELPRGNGELLLLVDDEERIRTMGRLLLQRLGYSVITAEDGADGLKKIDEDQPPAGLIVDMHMPGIDGLEMISTVRLTRPDLPIIASSGRFDEETKTRLEQLRVTAILPKPYSEEQLLGALQVLHPPLAPSSDQFDI